jgi:hypothetical protein
MRALRHLKSWWITDDPDDMARERQERDTAVETLDRITAVVTRLRARLADMTHRGEELQRRADHYRLGWKGGRPFVEHRADAGASSDRLELPRTG